MLAFHHDTNVAILTGEQSYTNVNGIQRLVINTKSWHLQAKWIDQSTDRLPLHRNKESNPIETAEHDMANSYSNELDFRWWVRKVLMKHDMILNKVKSRCQKNIFKFGVEFPLTV